MTHFARFAAVGLLSATTIACHPATHSVPSPRADAAPTGRITKDSASSISALRIDPLTLVSVREYRRIMQRIGSDVFPNWRTDDIPILLYRPGVQDILISAPRRPRGYSVFTGSTVLGNETIYARNDSTLMPIDDQNTSATLDSMRVLVVADRASRERNKVRANLARGLDVAEKWLNEWGFVESPYDELEILMHEAFHVHQNRLAPGKHANESVIARYPALDPVNNAFIALEGRLIRDALTGNDGAFRRNKAEQFLAVRHARRAALDTAVVAYEDLNEYNEGLGRYVELRFEQLGERLTPAPEMYFQAGFEGYRGVLRNRFLRRIDDLVKITANSDNRYENPFGGFPVRFRTYELGGTQGLLLDQFAPMWKQRIFAPRVSLSDLLTEALPLSREREAELVRLAKQTYGYDTLLANRRVFQAEGLRRIQRRVDSILRTQATLVVIDYGAAGDALGLGYTPFGVTAVSDSSAIYDLVPIAVRFPNKVVLRMKSVIPAIIDRRARTVTFAITSPPSELSAAVAGTIDLREFSLTGGNSSMTRISVAGNRAVIHLR